MTNSINEMKEEREGPAEEQEPADKRADQGLGGVEGLGPDRRGDGG